MKLRSGSGLVLLAALVTSAALPAHAQPHVDVLFYALEGRVAVGATDFDTPALIADVRVFPVALDFDDATSSPGFTGSSSPPAGEPLPGGVPVRFDLLPVPLLAGRNLSYWDLTGPVAFSNPAGSSVILVQKGCLNCEDDVVADGTSAERPGFTLGVTGDQGELHRHHDFLLAPPAGSGNPAPNGVYLLSLRGRVEGLLPSDPFFVVFGNGTTPTQLEDAALWVEANLLVPEPGASALGACALGTLATLRARRQRAVIESMISNS